MVSSMENITCYEIFTLDTIVGIIPKHMKNSIHPKSNYKFELTANHSKLETPILEKTREAKHLDLLWYATETPVNNFGTRSNGIKNTVINVF